MRRTAAASAMTCAAVTCAMVAAIQAISGPARAAGEAAGVERVDKCSPDRLGEAIRDGLAERGRTEDEFREMLSSSLMRLIIRARIIDGSGCDETVVDEALKRLAGAPGTAG